MFRPDQPDALGPDGIPADYQPRVVVKLRDDEDTRARVASLAVAHPGRQPESPEQLSSLHRDFPGAEIEPLFTATTPARLAALIRDAEREHGEKAPNFLNFFTVTVPRGEDPGRLIAAAQDIPGVERAYLQGVPTPPPVVKPKDDPRSSNQGYLDPAPDGIDARSAWKVDGGDGKGIGFIDVEQGWTLNHEDLSGAKITLISGLNKAYPGHGTAVLGEVVAQDNTRGCIGITPLATARVVSQHRTSSSYSTADAIVSAIVESERGDVILLEAQTTLGGTHTFLPVEVELDVWAAIRIATWLGRVVVEAAGNGQNDLDAYSDPVEGFILQRGHNDFRESGAIMVGGATSTVPHKRRTDYSNYGSRIDCYAWGENIDTTGDGFNGTSTTAYTTSFNGTSGASPIVTGAAIALQGMSKAKHGTVYTPARLRELLTDSLLNTASDDPAVDRIGVMPDLRAIAIAEGFAHPVGDFPLPRKDVQFAGVYGSALIDPGHGGAVDSRGSTAYGSPVGPGAEHAALEKDINLDVARRVCNHLGSQAVLTRSGDYNLSLRERIERARAARASAFVSIHSNTGRTDHGGPEVWIYGDGRSKAGPQSQQLAQRIRQELSAIDRAAVPVRAGKLAVLRPDLHGPGVAACLVETGSLEHPRGAARLRDARALDAIGAAVARGVSQYLSKDLRRGSGQGGKYGSPATVLERPRPVVEPQAGPPAQLCYHLAAEPHQSNWWDAALPVGALVDTAPPELRELLSFLEVSYATFAPVEGAYFAAIGEHLHRHGVVDSATALDASNFAGAIREFQGRTGINASGTADERTLWALQKDWAAGRQLSLVKCPADKVAGSDGYDRFRLRSDIADHYLALHAAVQAAGGIITSAGSFRDLSAQVTVDRSTTSMHYSGLALDLATDTGMLNPAKNPYLITQEGRKWRVWCRSEAGEERELDAVRWRGGATHTEKVTAKVIDFTACAESHGFRSIPARSVFPENYMGAEWWHFQCELPLTPYVSQFGCELLSLAMYSETELAKHTGIWSNRMKVFKKGRGGWY